MLAAFLLALSIAAPGEEAPLKVGELAPTFSLKTMNPVQSKLQLFTLGRNVGDSPSDPKTAVVLSFAASYCEPCKKELAEFKALEPKLNKAGIVLAVVIIDTEAEGIESMKKLTVDELKLPYPVLSDRFGVLAKRYRAYTLPYTVIIDKTGTISWLHSGFAEGSIAKLTAQLKI